MRCRARELFASLRALDVEAAPARRGSGANPAAVSTSVPPRAEEEGLVAGTNRHNKTSVQKEDGSHDLHVVFLVMSLVLKPES